MKHVLERPVLPMEPKLWKEPFNSSEYFFQVKWDGIRIISFIQKGKIRLQSKKGWDRTLKFPELEILKKSVKAHEAILDGEVVVIKNSKPSFPMVMKRALVQNIHTIRRYAKTLPVNYILFDVIYYNGRDLSRIPLMERVDILNNILEEKEGIYIIENFSQGLQLFQAVTEQGLEGIVAKLKKSPYIFGKKSSYWKKIKNRRHIHCVVGGFLFKNHRLSSVLLGVYADDNNLHYVGRAGSGLGNREMQIIKESLEEIKTDHSPFVNTPRFTRGTVFWVKPILTVLVEYSEWTNDVKLRAPTIVGFTKKHPEECRLY